MRLERVAVVHERVEAVSGIANYFWRLVWVHKHMLL